jgi:microcompartment protein CcmK/EutM
MRLGRIIGKVTLNKAVTSLRGGRFLIVTPFTREHMQQGTVPPQGLSRDPSPVVYDNLGAGEGDSIGYVEGREAAMPFDEPTPVDAFCAAILDEVSHQPLP